MKLTIQGYNKKRKKKYTDKHYKNLVIPDKDDMEKARMQREKRTRLARERLMGDDGGTLDVYQNEIDKKKKLKKRRKHRRVAIRLSGMVAVVATVIVIFTVIIPASNNVSYAQGYEVKLNGTVIGVTDSPEPISQALEGIRNEFSQIYQMNVYDDTELTYSPVTIDMQFICPSSYFVNILKSSIDAKVMAWVINVNNAPAAAVKTKEEADSILAKILEPFQNIDTQNERKSIGFVESVNIQEYPIEYSRVGNEEDAYMLLKYGGAIEEKYHRVVSGETLYSIAKRYSLKVADLRKANPPVASTNSIYPDDRLLVISPNNRVNIKYVDTVRKYDAVMDYAVEYVEDDTKFKTQRTTIQYGVTGVHDIVAEVTYINGVEVDTKVLSETVKQAPVNQIVSKGTKSVPMILELAVEGDMPIPLRSGSYRISSKFGPRGDIGIPGASKWHKGSDLAASTGTPIYASMAGTITHSGSGTGYGLYIKIDHGGSGVETRYGHCSQLIVKKGDKVEAGELIALVGNTGISGGSHLHWEVRINGVAYDPFGEYPTPAP